MEVNQAEAAYKGESMLLPPVAKLYSGVRVMKNYTQRAFIFITARNLSELHVDRINVYMSGREDPILGTDFDGRYPKEHHMSQFFSSIGGEVPYTIKAIVSQGEKEMLIRRNYDSQIGLFRYQYWSNCDCHESLC